MLSHHIIDCVMSCCSDSAENRSELTIRGFTHIVNCAHTARRGGPDYYKGMNITYLGIEGRDSPEYDMSVNFNTAADFIHRALNGGGGQIPLLHQCVFVGGWGLGMAGDEV